MKEVMRKIERILGMIKWFDIGYFEEHPVDVVSIKNGVVSGIVFSRIGLNQSKLNWLYYLKDKKIKIDLDVE